jgi:molybdopterin-binding protein
LQGPESLGKCPGQLRASAPKNRPPPALRTKSCSPETPFTFAAADAKLPGVRRGHSRKRKTDMANFDKLYTPREAAQVLGISYPTLKQWIYKNKIRTIRTVGGHHRIPVTEVDAFLYRASERRKVAERRTGFRHVSGRNQLTGRITDVRVEGLLAQITLSIGGQRITSIITADAVREMRLKPGDKAAALIKSTEVMIIKI